MMLNRIDNLDAAEIHCNAASSNHLAKVTLQDLLYLLTLEDGSPLFLQLTQRPSGEVDKVISNTPKFETNAEKINHCVAAWCIMLGKIRFAIISQRWTNV
jgi:hypothetical protein